MVSLRLLTALYAAACHAQVPNPVDPAALTPLYEQVLQEREQLYGESSTQVAQAALDLGLQLKVTGDLSGAERMLRRALDISNSPESAEGLAGVLEAQGHAEESLKLYRRAAEGPSDEVAARSLARAAAIAERSRNPQAAVQFYRAALAREEKASGPDNPKMAVRLIDLGVAARDPELLRHALRIQERAFGPVHPAISATLSDLSVTLLRAGKAAEAEPFARRALAVLEKTRGPRHPLAAKAASNLADVLSARGDSPAARRFYEQALAIDEAAYGPLHPKVALDLKNLAGMLEKMGEKTAARKLTARAAAIEQAQ